MGRTDNILHLSYVVGKTSTRMVVVLCTVYINVTLHWIFFVRSFFRKKKPRKSNRHFNFRPNSLDLILISIEFLFIFTFPIPGRLKLICCDFIIILRKFILKSDFFHQINLVLYPRTIFFANIIRKFTLYSTNLSISL